MLSIVGGLLAYSKLAKFSEQLKDGRGYVKIFDSIFTLRFPRHGNIKIGVSLIVSSSADTVARGLPDDHVAFSIAFAKKTEGNKSLGKSQLMICLRPEKDMAYNHNGDIGAPPPAKELRRIKYRVIGEKDGSQVEYFHDDDEMAKGHIRQLRAQGYTSLRQNAGYLDNGEFTVIV